jgi:hypothetical protein
VVAIATTPNIAFSVAVILLGSWSREWPRSAYLVIAIVVVLRARRR